MRKIPNTTINDKISDLKQHFTIEDFNTINNVLYSDYSPNSYTRLDRVTINQEVNLIKNIAKDESKLELFNYNLKFTVYATFFNWICENIIEMLIDQFKFDNIKEITEKQQFILKKISYKILSDTNRITTLFSLSKIRQPFFTNSLIYEFLHKLLSEFEFVLDEIRQNKIYHENNFWKDKSPDIFHSLTNKDFRYIHKLYPKPISIDVFYKQEYKDRLNSYISRSDNKNTTYREIYNLAREFNEEINIPVFDFKINKTELTLLFYLLYYFGIITPTPNNGMAFHEYSYSNVFNENLRNADREISIFIENFCTINNKKIKGVKKLLNEIKWDLYKHEKTIYSLLEKLKTTDSYNYKKNKYSFFPIKVQDDSNYYQSKPLKELILFNFNVKKRIIVCLLFSISSNNQIANYNSNTVENLYFLLNDYTSFNSDNKYNLKGYIGDYLYNTYDYNKLYVHMINSFKEKINNVFNT